MTAEALPTNATLRVRSFSSNRLQFPLSFDERVYVLPAGPRSSLVIARWLGSKRVQLKLLNAIGGPSADSLQIILECI